LEHKHLSFFRTSHSFRTREEGKVLDWRRLTNLTLSYCRPASTKVKLWANGEAPILKEELCGKVLKYSAKVQQSGSDLRPAGLEPTTYSSGGCRSIQLSYGRDGLRLYGHKLKAQPPRTLARHTDQKLTRIPPLTFTASS
jgi:hypothetical protein